MPPHLISAYFALKVKFAGGIVVLTKLEFADNYCPSLVIHSTVDRTEFTANQTLNLAIEFLSQGLHLWLVGKFISLSVSSIARLNVLPEMTTSFAVVIEAVLFQLKHSFYDFEYPMPVAANEDLDLKIRGVQIAFSVQQHPDFYLVESFVKHGESLD